MSHVPLCKKVCAFATLYISEILSFVLLFLISYDWNTFEMQYLVLQEVYGSSH